MNHPAQYSPEVIEVLEGLIQPGERILDPFAGTGLRLGALCDRIGADFQGGDIEKWPGRDPRVQVRDATDIISYPIFHEFTVVTSPVYLNKRMADYANGPLPTTNIKGRRDYGISLGRALHENNLARYTGKPSRAVRYWALHRDAVRHWGNRAIVNVDSPIADRWEWLLKDEGYKILDAIPVYTRRYGGLANADKRAEYEIVMEAVR